jgi:hypothetical protein
MYQPWLGSLLEALELPDDWPSSSSLEDSDASSSSKVSEVADSS